MTKAIPEIVAATWMNQVIYEGFITLTPWKIVGLVGATMFGGRWVVQIIASTFAGRSVIPRTFWIMSLTGSVLALTYFVFGKSDSVGVVQNLPGCFVASYNLFLEIRSGCKTQSPRPESLFPPLSSPGIRQAKPSLHTNELPGRGGLLRHAK